MHETIACRPEDVLDFVMDIERYAEVDTKISPVLWSRRDGDVVEFACRPKLAGLRQPTVVQHVRRSSGRVDITLAPPPRNRLAHAVAEFAAHFVCVPTDEGARVTRTLTFRFSPVVRWLLEPWFRRRLPTEVGEEIRLAKAHLER